MKITRTHILSAVGAAGVVLAVLSSRASGQATEPRQPARVAFISMQRVGAESLDGKRDNLKLQTLQQQKQTSLRGKQQLLEATRQKLAQAGDNAARSELLQQEQLQRTDLERATATAQAELTTLQRELQADMQAKLRPVIDEVGRKEGVQMMLNADTAVMWATPGLDLTQQVIQRMNEAAAPPAKP